MQRGDVGGGRRAPTLGVVVAVVVLGSTPFLLAATDLATRALRGVLWILAAATLLYLVVTAWRIYTEHGTGAVVRWVVSGSIPPR